MDIQKVTLLNLKRLAKERQINQKKLADLTGKSPQQISNIFRGRDAFARQMITEFSAALQVDESEFYRQESDIQPNKDGAPIRVLNDAVNVVMGINEVYAYGDMSDIKALENFIAVIQENTRLKKRALLAKITCRKAADGYAVSRKQVATKKRRGKLRCVKHLRILNMPFIKSGIALIGFGLIMTTTYNFSPYIGILIHSHDLLAVI